MCNCGLIIKEEDETFEKYVCRNTYCRNEICDECVIICDCCDNKICKMCAARCEITEDGTPCSNYLCIPIIKTMNSKTSKYEFNYNKEDANPCWTRCGINYVCVDHNMCSNDEDLVICSNCVDGAKYICKCGDCFEHKIYKNCEEKCQVKADCPNYIQSNHMLKNDCKKCKKTYEYSCIDCFIIDESDEKAYCVNCADDK